MATVTASGDETMARRRAVVDRLVLLGSGVPELLPVLIHAAHEDGTWPLTRHEVQAAVDRLSAAGLLGMVAGRPVLSAAGDALWRSMQRSKPAGQRARIAQVVDDHPPGDTIGWVPTPDEWDGALAQVRHWTRQKTEARLDIVDGLLRAIDHGVAIIELSQRSEDRMAVVAALLGPPFSFSEIQAQHVLDRTVAGFSQTARDKLLEEAAELRAPSHRAP